MNYIQRRQVIFKGIHWESATPGWTPGKDDQDPSRKELAEQRRFPCNIVVPAQPTAPEREGSESCRKGKNRMPLAYACWRQSPGPVRLPGTPRPNAGERQQPCGQDRQGKRLFVRQLVRQNRSCTSGSPWSTEAIYRKGDGYCRSRRSRPQR